MKQRFEGESGFRLLIETLKKQDIVEHDESFATAIARAGELVEFASGSDIIIQDDSDNSILFLLSGQANVFVNDRFIGTREEGSCIGEMAALDAAARRSATVRAKTDVLTLRVSEVNFRAALESHPHHYRALAQLVAYRLRQRSEFYQPPNPEPVLFIGCSTEALGIANELQAAFKHDRMSAIIWTNGVFGPSGTALESLLKLADSADFAAFVISPDDTVISRKHEQDAPRDNVIFELGLFMGKLDPKRVFLIKEHSADVKIPSDLLGITPVTYVMKSSGNIEVAIGPVCTELRKVISELGVR
jgi:CRP/FNR family transcriptional regulator, cyclic AMP receptor protein